LRQGLQTVEERLPPVISIPFTRPLHTMQSILLVLRYPSLWCHVSMVARDAEFSTSSVVSGGSSPSAGKESRTVRQANSAIVMVVIHIMYKLPCRLPLQATCLHWSRMQHPSPMKHISALHQANCDTKSRFPWSSGTWRMSCKTAGMDCPLACIQTDIWPTPEACIELLSLRTMSIGEDRGE
jgi:hypothetical protein